MLLVFGCANPVPPEKAAYVGEWRSRDMYLQITPGGRVEYRRRNPGGGTRSIEAPIQRFVGDDFEVGLGPLSTRFVVSVPPRRDADGWRMVVDGVELTR
jgi:hypothetical protein